MLFLLIHKCSRLKNTTKHKTNKLVNRRMVHKCIDVDILEFRFFLNFTSTSNMCTFGLCNPLIVHLIYVHIQTCVDAYQFKVYVKKHKLRPIKITNKKSPRRHRVTVRQIHLFIIIYYQIMINTRSVQLQGTSRLFRVSQIIYCLPWIVQILRALDGL